MSQQPSLDNLQKQVIPHCIDLLTLSAAIDTLSWHKNDFNKIEIVENEANSERIPVLFPERILEDFKLLEKFIKEFVDWRDDIARAVLEPKQSVEIYKKIIDMSKLVVAHRGPIQRRVTALDMFNMDTIKDCLTHLTAMALIVSEVDLPEICYESFSMLHNRIVSLVSSGLVIFNEKKIEQDPDWRYYETMDLKLSEHVVTYTAEEIQAMEQAKREKEEAEQKEKELNAAKAKTSEEASLVLQCYNNLLNSGNLSKIKLTDAAIHVLKDPSTPDECAQADSLYKFLMAMSSTVRYMPGEKGDPTDRIMGSFMELEKDVATYNQPFMIYLHEFGVSTTNIADSVDMFELVDGSQLQAQFVDTKTFIDKTTKNPSGPKTIHIFKM